MPGTIRLLSESWLAASSDDSDTLLRLAIPLSVSPHRTTCVELVPADGVVVDGLSAGDDGEGMSSR
jgi:hypothetical protein